jgi:hypothetical protein
MLSRTWNRFYVVLIVIIVKDSTCAFENLDELLNNCMEYRSFIGSNISEQSFCTTFNQLGQLESDCVVGVWGCYFR